MSNEPTGAELFERRGEIFAGVWNTRRRNPNIDATKVTLARMLPEAQQRSLANAVTEVLRRAAARPIRESANCACLKIGHGGKCAQCGSN